MTSTGRTGNGPTNRYPANRRGRRGGAGARDRGGQETRHQGDPNDPRPPGHNPPRLERDPDSPLGKGEDISLQPREHGEDGEDKIPE